MQSSNDSKPPVNIIDTTLREGAQAAYVYFDESTQIAIARELDRVGVREVELPWMPEQNNSLVDAIKSRTSLSVSLWVRALRVDIERALAMEPAILSVALPTSDLHIEKRLRQDRFWVLRQIEVITELVRAHSTCKLRLGLEDASRADPEFLRLVARVAQGLGVDAIRIADTVGICTPRAMSDLVRICRSEFSRAIGIHAHNDFGMATANCLAAVEQGADSFDASVLGVGDRAGIARLEELVGYFALVEQDQRFFPQHLTNLCALVAAASGSTIDARHPVIGRALFSTESGIHIDGIAKDPQTYEPFSPEKVGARRRFLYGQKSGQGALRVALAAWGMKPEGVDLPKVLRQVRALSTKLRRPLNRREIEALLA